MDFGAGFSYCGSKPFADGSSSVKEKEGVAFSAAGSDGRELAKRFNQVGESGRIFGHEKA
jgi:hypothetical protein